ncbi:MAG: Flp pilus assembly protein CpaB [Thermoguttaceae bacterium]
MRVKSIVLLVLALGCGAVASVGIIQVVAKRGAEVAPAQGEDQAIFVASKDVPQGDPLNGQCLKLVQWPKDKVPAGALGRLEDIEGRRTRTKLFAEEPILDSKLAVKGANAPGADILIPKGYRVVSIRVDAVSGGGNLLLPGCRVDILVHMAKNPGGGIPETTTRTILQDIKVFAVNEIVNLENGGPETKSIQVRTVSLLVTPAQAELVMLATELGSIKLVMRSPEEETQTQTDGALPHQLLGIAGKSQRDKEESGEDAGLGNLKDKGKEFNDFLSSLRKKDDVKVPAPEPPPEEIWSMRILNGAEMNDVIMREAANSALADASWWSVSGVKSTPGKKGQAAESKTPPPPEENKPAKPGSGPGNGGRGNQAALPGNLPLPPATPAAS